MSITISISDSSKITKKILEAAKNAKSETEIQFEIERQIMNYFEKKKFAYKPAQNVTVIKGRPDTLYGHVIIEYKVPGTLKSLSKLDLALIEAHDNIIEVSNKTKEDRSKFLGIIIDGLHITFTKYRNHKWINESLVEVSTESIKKMLESLRGLSRKPLESTSIVADFGPDSELAKDSVKKLFQIFKNSKDPRAEVLYKEWHRIFNQVCGYDFVSPKLSVKSLLDAYDLKVGKTDIAELLFVVHTYYALFIKMLAAEITVTFASKHYNSFLEELIKLGPQKFKQSITDLEEGGIFSELGIKNFLEGDYFAWYIDTWNNDVRAVIDNIARKLIEYEPATTSLEPEVASDLLKNLYEQLVPKKIRHDLGEYFTPSWLVEILLKEIGYDGDKDKKVLDPSCGSGSFIVSVIKKIISKSTSQVKKNILLDKILKNIIGFDLNPLAIIAARANYLIAISDLLPHRTSDIYIPIYLCDSISVQSKQTLSGNICEVTTGVGTFMVPVSILKHEFIDKIFSLIDDCVKNLYKPSEFIERMNHEVDIEETDLNTLEQMYNELVKLERLHVNRIWTRVIKNSLAPLFVGKFDYVIGNPPWVNWENLPKYYRDSIKDIWIRYKLAEASKTSSSFKRDISMTFIAVGRDRYLEKNGKLGLLIPFTLFKNQAGGGFRKYLATNCDVFGVHDMVKLQPFENAVTRTSLILLKEGKTKFPIPSIKWTINQNKSLSSNLSYDDALYYTTRKKLSVSPIEGEKSSESSWFFVDADTVKAIQNVLGASEYEATEGSNTRGGNGIFWIKIMEKIGSNLRIKNITEGAKIKIPDVTFNVEDSHVYPLLRGRDVSKWKSSPQQYILVPHDEKTGKPFEESKLKIKSPKTFEYFFKFKKNLENRKLYGKLIKDKFPFFVMFQVNKDSFSKYKVVWREIAGEISGAGEFFASVVEPSQDKFTKGKPILIDHKLMSISISTKEEAHYLAGMLNSSPIRLIVSGYTIETAISTHVLKHVNIPKFDPKNKIHQEIASKAMEISNSSKDQITPLEYESDQLVSKIYGITPTQIRVIQKSST